MKQISKLHMYIVNKHVNCKLQNIVCQFRPRGFDDKEAIQSRPTLYSIQD